MLRRALAPSLGLALLVTTAACGGTTAAGPSTTGGAGGSGGGGAGGSGPVEARYVVPGALADLANDTFFDHPFPSDLRLEGGHPRYTGWPNPRVSALLQQFIDVVGPVTDGFSPAAAGYLRFTGAVDPATLPKTPLAAQDASSSVQLLDVDPASPEKGTRRLVSLEWRADEGVYWQPLTLAFMPTLGFPLRPKTRYALVVTDALKAPGGAPVRPSADLAAVLGLASGDARTDAAKATLTPALDALDAAGVPRARIVHLAVFTTSDPVGELFAVRDDVMASVPAPTAEADKWAVMATSDAYDEYVGRYGPSPNYQAGTLPFATEGSGGDFQLEGGKPKLVDTFDLRFSLSVPNAAACPMPAAGYPIVLYAHGTGGNYRSYTGDGTAASLTGKCLAAMGVDQIFHGDRPGAPNPPDDSKQGILFYNFQNPRAGRTNGRQSAIDEVQRARLFTETKMVVPASVSKTGAEIRFDPTKVLFFGHSQGGLNGPLYLAADASARGGVLSGSSASIAITFLQKTMPTPSIAALVQSVFLGLKPDEYAELDVFHPALSIGQALADVIDPMHYARFTIASPRGSNPPKSIYLTEGINPDGTGDHYAPPHGIEVHGLALGLPLQLPSQHAIEESAWGGPPATHVPAAGLAGNLAGGKASGVLAQWPVPAGGDGHFVVFDVPAARAQAAGFLQNLAADPLGRVPAP
jgi:hypothetical protein